VPVRKKRPAKAKAKRPLDSLKYEVARELDLPKEVLEEGYWGESVFQTVWSRGRPDGQKNDRGCSKGHC
jgi:hypothetical protein